MRHILFLVTALSLTFPVFGQQVVIRNPEISQLVQQVNADSLKKYTEKLASFHSRHTLNTDAENGMIAAQNYVKSKFMEFGMLSKGRMTASIEEFIVPGDGRRIVTDAKVGNVIAKLPGTNPNDPRVIIVSGHLDSRKIGRAHV
jgi:acetylornithine deacetylase/succinyl-diaminopimelate desuccinylase-like protein